MLGLEGMARVFVRKRARRGKVIVENCILMVLGGGNCCVVVKILEGCCGLN